MTGTHSRRRPFRFGVATHGARNGREWRDLARRVEGQGYATLLISDHANPQFAPIPALAFAAAATDTIRLGTQVLCNDFRNPVLLAKEVATLDVLSDGRFDWGMGAGWLPSDYEATGISFDPPGERVGRMIESVDIMRRLFGGETVDHSGRFYETKGAICSPPPLQSPHPRLLIGGADKRMMRFAGSMADIVSISPGFAARSFGDFPASMGVEEYKDRQIGWVREGAGERFSSVELSITVLPVRVLPDDGCGEAVVRQAAEEIGPTQGVTTDEALVSPHVLIGSVGQICDTLLERRERWGLSNWVFPSGLADSLALVVARLTGT